MVTEKEIIEIRREVIRALTNDVKTIQLQVTNDFDNILCNKILRKFDERYRKA